jgi:DNA processing protein
MRSSFPEEARDAPRIVAVPRDAASYPEPFRQLTPAPSVIYTCGTFAVALPPAVAIVGTRRASPYGRRVAHALATTCAHAGVCVVSGLAHGIDGTAHQAALDAGGRTVAVLGTGPDICYPRSHRLLQAQIARDGLLISEFPPGSTGHGGAFPQRNRLIAALASVTVIVEAPEKSGALHTANYAQDLGRTVAVVPNAIDVPSAKGSNALLREAGVYPILDVSDLLALLQLSPAAPCSPVLGGTAAEVWDGLQRGFCTVTELAANTALTLADVQGALGLLEIEGLVQFDAMGQVRPMLR